jgi:hypothetical protein
VPTRRERIAEAAPYALAAIGLYITRGQGWGDQLSMAIGMGLFVPIGALLLIMICEYVTTRIVDVKDRDALPDRVRTYAAMLAIVSLYGLAQRSQENQLERLVQCIQDEQTTEYGTEPITGATLRWCDEEYYDDDTFTDLEL